jgi:prepilin-type N-terminal cleavage/methylation domain-containing protein
MRRRLRSGRDQRGFTVVEVLVAAAVLVVGVVGLSGAFSVAFTDVVASSGESKATAYARQQIEVLKNQAFAAMANGNDTPEPQYARTWTVQPVAGTVAPNRVSTITVNVTWRQGWSRSKTVILQTNRMEWL